ncbi:hypothetical protein EDD21DRAFT_375715 [Dissophora ornata]|nr:hypothetical protein EDD21DRAFT_375715 [Dissophora ornata]
MASFGTPNRARILGQLLWLWRTCAPLRTVLIGQTSGGTFPLRVGDAPASFHSFCVVRVFMDVCWLGKRLCLKVLNMDPTCPWLMLLLLKATRLHLSHNVSFLPAPPTVPESLASFFGFGEPALH